MRWRPAPLGVLRTNCVSNTTPPRVSVIVTTYNWPSALDLVLDSLSGQTFSDFEVVVADDGSGAETRTVIDDWQSRFPVPLKHVWQEDDGFRAARARNLAVREAAGDYVVFLDGDCLVLPTFLANHLRYASTDWFTVGRRCFMRKGPSKLIEAHRWRVHAWPRAVLVTAALFGGSNRPFQLISLPVSHDRRRNRPKEWNKAQTCNLGVWREDVLDVGGFDEGYGAYGLEDTDFVIRLIRSGRQRITLEHADPVLHLWHQRKKTASDNRDRLAAMESSHRITPEQSILLPGNAPVAEPSAL